MYCYTNTKNREEIKELYVVHEIRYIQYHVAWTKFPKIVNYRNTEKKTRAWVVEWQKTEGNSQLVHEMVEIGWMLKKRGTFDGMPVYFSHYH